MELANYLPKLEDFTVYKAQTLFDTPDFIECLKEKRCPICTCKIYLNLKGTRYFCKSKKHLSFNIEKAKVDKYA